MYLSEEARKLQQDALERVNNTLRLPGDRSCYVPREIRELAASTDPTAWAVAADWLEEQGDPERATFLRLGSEHVRTLISTNVPPAYKHAELYLGPSIAKLQRIEMPRGTLEVWSYYSNTFGFGPPELDSYRILIRNADRIVVPRVWRIAFVLDSTHSHHLNRKSVRRVKMLDGTVNGEIRAALVEKKRIFHGL